MKTVKEKTFINCSQEDCFRLSHDYGIRSDWDFFIKESKILEKDEVNLAPKKVWVKDRRGLKMIVKYTSYQPPKNASMKMISGPFFFSIFGGAWIFKKLTDQTTDTTFSYSFSLKWWVVPFLTNSIVKLILKKEIERRLLTFKQYCEKVFSSK
jgi:ribosome-associated toxin RatA of RatAB toxin-antitoxin module